MFRRVVVLVTASLFLLAPAIFAQSESRGDISISGTGNFTRESDGQGVMETATKSGGLLATYRFSLGHIGALDLNYGYTRNSQNYLFPQSFEFAGIQSNIHEATAAYVFTPYRSGRLTPFVMAGGGALVFSPTSTPNNQFLGADTQAKAAFLYGGGADYNLSRNFALRLQYRGLLYKAPDFNLPGFATGGLSHMAEPSAGIVFKF